METSVVVFDLLLGLLYLEFISLYHARAVNYVFSPFLKGFMRVLKVVSLLIRACSASAFSEKSIVTRRTP